MMTVAQLIAERRLRRRAIAIDGLLQLACIASLIALVWWNPFTWFDTYEKEPVVRTPRSIGGRPE